jgi:hypothetical protein
VKLSFRLFGLRFKSFYDTFFVLLAISALGFLWTFRSDVPAQVVLLFTLFAFAIEPHTAIFTSNMPTFTGLRHSSTLALIPMWYFTFLLLRASPLLVLRLRSLRLKLRREQLLGLLAVIVALFQLALLILAIKIRGSAIWSVIFVVSVGVAVAILPWWRTPGPRSYRLLLRKLCCWPTILVVGGLFMHGQYMKFVLHPVYFTDDVMPYHGLWHSAYIGLAAYGPEIVGPGIKEIGNLDAAAHAAAVEYLDRIHFLRPNPDRLSAPTGYISPWTGTIKFRLHDEIMRRAFFNAAVKYPLKTAKLYFVTKPWASYANLEQIIDRTPTATWLWLGCLGGLIGGLLLAWMGGVEAAGEVILPIVAAIPFATLPNMWAYSSFSTVADLFLTSLALFQACVAVGIMLVVHVAGNLRYKSSSATATRNH